jgi:hypothetical protein
VSYSQAPREYAAPCETPNGFAHSGTRRSADATPSSSPVSSIRFVGAISSPSWGGMMVVRGMSQSKVELPGAHGLSALIPRRRNGHCVRFPIGLLFSGDPVGRFGEMSGHGAVAF